MIDFTVHLLKQLHKILPCFPLNSFIKKKSFGGGGGGGAPVLGPLMSYAVYAPVNSLVNVLCSVVLSSTVLLNSGSNLGCT